MNRTLNKLLLSFGTVTAVAAPVIVAVSCGSEGTTTTGGMTSATFSTVQGDINGVIIGKMLSPEDTTIPGVKTISLETTDILSGIEEDNSIPCFPEDKVIDMSTVSGDEYTMEELERDLIELNKQINVWLDAEFNKAYPEPRESDDLEKFNSTLRYKWELNPTEETLTINVYRLNYDLSTPLNQYVENVFLNPNTGIKQVPMENLAADDGFQYFMGVRPLTYKYLEDGFHLDANFVGSTPEEKETDFLTKLQGHKFDASNPFPSTISRATDLLGRPKIADEDYITFGPDRDIFVVVVPHMVIEQNEFYVNFEFYKGGMIQKGGTSFGASQPPFRTNVDNYTEKTVRTVKLKGAYPKDYTTEVSNWAADEVGFRNALVSTEALIKPAIMGMMDMISGQMPEYATAIEVVKQVGEIATTNKLFNNDEFVRALYENSITDPEISVSEFIKFGQNYTFDPVGIVTASGSEIKKLVMHVLLVYENADFITQWNTSHPAPAGGWTK